MLITKEEKSFIKWYLSLTTFWLIVHSIFLYPNYDILFMGIILMTLTGVCLPLLLKYRTKKIYIFFAVILGAFIIYMMLLGSAKVSFNFIVQFLFTALLTLIPIGISALFRKKK